jgi:hypothetical protein
MDNGYVYLNFSAKHEAPLIETLEHDLKSATLSSSGEAVLRESHYCPNTAQWEQTKVTFVLDTETYFTVVNNFRSELEGLKKVFRRGGKNKKDALVKMKELRTLLAIVEG